jgi:hypothetical protein
MRALYYPLGRVAVSEQSVHLNRSRLRYCLLLALAMLLGRLLFFDYRAFFQYQTVPLHDMYQGAPFFAMNMHAARISGDIAWWNPIANNGYAQYYQSFLSPLAPTPGHITTIVWTQIVRVLAALGYAIPEYLQFLIVTYIIQPFLAFFAFALFCSLLFRSRAVIALMLFVYTFSNIGLWNSAWYFFQEPFSFWLLIAACIALLQRPTVPRILFLLAAGLIQVASLNYWTLYNLFFFVVLLGAYLWVYPNQYRRLFARVRRFAGRYKPAAALVTVGVLAVVMLWGVLIGSMVVEQSGQNVRRVYTTEDARERMQELRRSTLELFNNNLQRPMQAYDMFNPQHNGRYLGAFLIPLLLIVPFYRWTRRERWLVAVAGCMLIIVLAPPFLIALWDAVPLMDMIVHLFYFYSTYWQIMLALLAGVSLEILLTRQLDARERRWIINVLAGTAAAALLALGGLALTSERYPLDDPNLESNLSLVLLVLIMSGALLRLLTRAAQRERTLVTAAILGLALTDLSNYFVSVSTIDQRYTRRRWELPLNSPLPEEVATALRTPWGLPSGEAGFNGDLFRYMPVKNFFWPDNTYMVPTAIDWLRYYPDVSDRLLNGDALVYYPEAAYVPATAETVAQFAAQPSMFDEQVLITGDPAPVSASAGQPGGDFSYTWGDWLYNRFSFHVSIPAQGWLVLRQLPDSNWQLTVNGQTAHTNIANSVSMALHLGAGEYDVQMEYVPLARRLYGIAGVVLEAALLGLVGLAMMSLTQRRKRAQRHLETGTQLPARTSS